MPTARLASVIEAWPPASSVANPIEVPASRKETVPVGVPEELVTVAVQVTACLKIEGFFEDESAVDELTLTAWLMAVDALAPKWLSPL